jgi:hypothetical protein
MDVLVLFDCILIVFLFGGFDWLGLGDLVIELVFFYFFDNAHCEYQGANYRIVGLQCLSREYRLSVQILCTMPVCHPISCR